jgi:UDP-N-acetylmuramoylalanine--D-glutamate ligase
VNIFKYQKRGDILIIRPDVKKLIKNTKSRLITVSAESVKNYPFFVPGKFQQENLACAVAVAKQFKIPIDKITTAIKNFKGIEGRLQFVKTVKGVKIYNDNNATTPEATMAGIEALSVVLKNPETRFRGNSPKPGFGENKIVLICGGADKKLHLASFVKVLNKYCKAVIFIPGTGTTKLLKNYKIKIPNETGKNLKDIVQKAFKYAQKGDILLFSPAFASFGMFNNEYERNDLFMKIIKKLK